MNFHVKLYNISFSCTTIQYLYLQIARVQLYNKSFSWTTIHYKFSMFVQLYTIQASSVLLYNINFPCIQLYNKS